MPSLLIFYHVFQNLILKVVCHFGHNFVSWKFLVTYVQDDTAVAHLRGAFNKSPDFFCTDIYNCCKLLKIQYVIAIHLMRWLTNLYDFWFKRTDTAANGIHRTKAWLSQLVNFKSGSEDTLEERCAIKFCFKLGKNDAKKYEMLRTAFRPSCMNRAWFFEWHKIFKEGRKSVREDERCGRSQFTRVDWPKGEG